jgi:ribonucleoside-diphosphate reductase beta chain
MSLLIASKSYKPFEYPWAYDFWKRQQQIHWMPEEVPLGEDCRDWAQKLSEHERNLLTQIFRFFTQADVEVQDCYHDKYGRVFKPTEIKMMLAAFSNMETVHIAAYSHLLDTIGMPESEYSAFLHYKEMKDKHDYMAQFGVDTDEDIARTLAMFGGFTEGLQLFASFAMLMNFPRFNKMKGMGQIVSWSIRDESLHCEGIIKLYHTFVKERDCLTPRLKDEIIDCCQRVVRLEDGFIDLAFEMGPVSGMTPKDIKKYVRYIADWRLKQLDLKPLYMSMSIRCRGLHQCSTALNMRTFLKHARQNIPKPPPVATGTLYGTVSTNAAPPAQQASPWSKRIFNRAYWRQSEGGHLKTPRLRSGPSVFKFPFSLKALSHVPRPSPIAC